MMPLPPCLKGLHPSSLFQNVSEFFVKARELLPPPYPKQAPSSLLRQASADLPVQVLAKQRLGVELYLPKYGECARNNVRSAQDRASRGSLFHPYSVP